jgi:hypothetical protein
MKLTTMSGEVCRNGKRLANGILIQCEGMGAEDVQLLDVRKRTSRP